MEAMQNTYRDRPLHKRFVLNKRDILVFIVLFPFIQQRTMQEFPYWLQMAYQYGSWLSAAYIYFEFFRRNSQITPRLKRLLPVFLIWVTYIVITIIIYPAKIAYTASNCFVLLAIALYVDIEVNNEPKRLLKVLAFIYTAYVLANNILVMIFPNGIYKVAESVFHKGHLLGDDNAIIYVALPGMVILALYSYMKKGKITGFAWFNILLCEVVLVRLWSGSALVCFALFIVLLFISVNIKKLPPSTELIAFLAIMILIFAGGSLPFVQRFVVNFLHKDVTFSSRSFMWAHAFQMFIERPLFGYGGYFTVGMNQYGRYSYPVHTPYLQMLIDGGLVLVAEYFLALRKGYANLQKHFNTVESQILAAGLTAISVNYIFEWSRLMHMMIILTLAINIDKLIASRERSN